jgi:hypothetical protein
LVCEELDDNNDEHAAAEEGVVRRHLVAGNAGGEEKDIGWRGDEPKEDLGMLAMYYGN